MTPHKVTFTAWDLVSMCDGSERGYVEVPNYTGHHDGAVLVWLASGAHVWVAADRLRFVRRNAIPTKPKRIGNITKHGR